MKYWGGGAREFFEFESRKWHLQHSETRIIRKPRIPGARVCLFAGSAVNNIVNNKNHDQRHQKRIKIGNRLTLLQSHF
jgi:hypothetical protein